MATSKQQVFEFMQNNPDKQFTVGQLARHFGTYPRAIKKFMDDLGEVCMVHKRTDEKSVKFFVMPGRVEQLNAKREIDTSFKPLSKNTLRAFHCQLLLIEEREKLWRQPIFPVN